MPVMLAVRSIYGLRSARPCLCLLLVLHLAATLGHSFCDKDFGCTYPLPTSVKQGNSTASVPVLSPDAGFAVTCTPSNGPACATVNSALERAVKRAFYYKDNSQLKSDVVARPIMGLDVTVTTSNSTALQHGVDESYTLTVPVGGHMQVSAATEWGALRGIETFVGLVAFNLSSDSYFLQVRAPAVIQDSPRTAWRGLLIDTSRHFLSVRTIEHAVEAMAMAKMNVLHWHLVDSGGWPMCLEATKQLCGERAYRDPWGRPAVYTVEDMQHVVAFAMARGVRVVPEFDLPGAFNRLSSFL